MAHCSKCGTGTREHKKFNCPPKANSGKSGRQERAHRRRRNQPTDSVTRGAPVAGVGGSQAGGARAGKKTAKN